MRACISSSQCWRAAPSIGPNERCRRSSSASRSSSALIGRIVSAPGWLNRCPLPAGLTGWPTGSTKPLHDLVADRVVRVYVLNLVGLLEHLDDLEDLLRRLFVDWYLDRRKERGLGRLVLDARLLQGGPHRHQVGRLADHLVGLAEVIDLLGTGVEDGHQHVVFARVGHRTAVAGKRDSHLGRRAVSVVGQALYEQRDPAGGVALVRHGLVRGAAGLKARAAADGPVDVVVGHRTALGLLHRVVQRRVRVHVGSAAARRYLDVLDQLGEQLSPPGVNHGLLVLRGRPLGVTAHDRSLTMSVKIECTRLSWVSSGWNAVASAGPWRTATILPVWGSVARISTPEPTSSTQGALMKTARNGDPAVPAISMSLSNESAWRPNALRLTVMSIAPSVSWSLA